ncbi:MAG TPA: OmpA family protein [Longimicrobiales bacterium]|nr:OmpA family protein [Longimicrobiales bacterium]
MSGRGGARGSRAALALALALPLSAPGCGGDRPGGGPQRGAAAGPGAAVEAPGDGGVGRAVPDTLPPGYSGPGAAAAPGVGVRVDPSSLQRVERVPLVEGLTVVTAVRVTGMDFESVKQVQEVGEDGYLLLYSADAPDRMGGKPRQVRVRRRVLWEDLRSAPTFRIDFGEDEPELFRGTTAIGLSSSVFQRIRDDGSGTLTVAGTPTAEHAVYGMLTGTPEFTGAVTFLEEALVPVAVNGVASALPAVRVRGTLTDDVDDLPFEADFLDDARHPIALRWRLADEGLDVVAIDWPGDATFDVLEERLSLGESVTLPGIYFDFGSDVLRPQSERALDAAAAMLGTHPEWRLRIEGHTDSVGDDAANRALSARRAEAVRRALAQRLGGEADRFDAVGLGESQPVASNASLEGRARNRRVELARIDRR